MPAPPSNNSARARLSEARRVIVKVGSSSLIGGGARLDGGYIRALSRQIAAARDGDEEGENGARREIILVSSGAVAAGLDRLGWKARPRALVDLQAAAAVGQMALIDAYEAEFARHRLHAAQMLLTAEDLAHRELYLNARATLRRLLDLRVVPVVNENDAIAAADARFGDNDDLAAQLTNLIEVDLLILLTDRDGLRAADGEIVREAAAEDDTLLRHIEEKPRADKIGVGGMASKLRAAKIAARAGAHTVIADGRAEAILRRVLAGEEIGTFLRAETPPLSARKRWLASGLSLRGELVVDDGAARAVRELGRSLLPAGIVAARGGFARGDAVRVVDGARQTLGFGLVNYTAAQIDKLRGRNSAEIKSLLGYAGEEEIIHRDNLSVVR